MTLADAQRAMLALYAVREAGPRGSLEEMRAVACCIRERVRAGWHDGSWMSVLEHAHLESGNTVEEPMRVDPNSRTLQRMLSEVDDIYYAQARHHTEQDDGLTVEASIAEHKLKYWCFLNRPMRAWFVDNIVRDPKNHPNRGQMGNMMFYE